MKVLVFGGNGFIGSHLVELLIKEGHSVRVFDRSLNKFIAPLSEVDYRIDEFDNDLAMLRR